MAIEDPAESGRKKFLVIVDETPECRVALLFGAYRAERTASDLVLMHVLEPAQFQHWAAVKKVMRQEAQEAAEQLLEGFAAEVRSWVRFSPDLVIREGKKREQVLALIEEDPEITLLVLGAASGREGPGPLVQHLAGELSGGLRIPVVLVPGNLTEDDIDRLT